MPSLSSSPSRAGGHQVISLISPTKNAVLPVVSPEVVASTPMAGVAPAQTSRAIPSIADRVTATAAAADSSSSSSSVKGKPAAAPTSSPNKDGGAGKGETKRDQIQAQQVEALTRELNDGVYRHLPKNILDNAREKLSKGIIPSGLKVCILRRI